MDGPHFGPIEFFQTIKTIFDSEIHRLRTPRQRLFFLKSQTFGLGQTNWTENVWGIWNIFTRFISTHFGTLRPMFSVNQILFLQKTKASYPNPKYLFGI